MRKGHSHVRDPRFTEPAWQRRVSHAGTGSESLMLADWSSLHLDIIAGDRGLQRLAASLYTL